MKRLLFFVLILFFSSGNSALAKSGFTLITSANELRMGLPSSINPDANNFQVSLFDLKWNNKVGGELGLFKYDNDKFNVGFGVGGFINIHDFESLQFMSWQLWRASLGGSLHFEYKPLSSWLGAKDRLMFKGSYVHESQHATDVYGYVYSFTYQRPNEFDNGGIRSFEYIQFMLSYAKPIGENWNVYSNVFYKYFPKPALGTPSQMFSSGGYELGITRALSSKANVYAQYYFESIENNFDADKQMYINSWKRTPFTYKILELGLNVNNGDRSFTPFININHSNGRGLDFINFYRTVSFGIRIEL